MLKTKRGKSGVAAMLGIAVMAAAILGVAYFALAYFGVFGKSSGGFGGSDDGAWNDQFVYYKLTSSNKFTGASVDPTFYIYKEKPVSCWDKPRNSCDETADGTYSSTSGTATINQEKPGKYYVRAVLSGYYTQFFEIEIRNGPSTLTQTLSDYNAQPEARAVKWQQADALTTSDMSLTVSGNVTGKEYTLTEAYTVTDNYCYQPWKLRVYEVNNSLTDYGVGASYDGVRELKLYIEEKPYTVIDLANAVSNGFSTNGATEYFEIDVSSQNLQICDGQAVDFKAYVKANTRDSGAVVMGGDQLLGNNETVAQVWFYDQMGTKAPTSGYVDIKGALVA